MRRHGHGRRHGFMPLGRFVRARLHRRLFLWFGATIVLSFVSVGLTLAILGTGRGSWRSWNERAERFVGSQLASAWDDPARRDALVADAARDLEVDITVLDAHGRVLTQRGGACERPSFRAPVRRNGRELGSVVACVPPGAHHGGATVFLVLAVAAVTLWGAAGLISRRLVRPLRQLEHVAEQIGSGDLGARARLDENRHGEIARLGHAINDMATRIEHQLADQRELLAAVSHEIRSPLARLRVLAELLRQQAPSEAARLAELERELEEIDELVGDLLAGSRLDFGAVERRRVDPRDLAERAAERAGLDRSLVSVEGEPATVLADGTLIARALANLLDNAQRHGGGASALRVQVEDGATTFSVEDAGPGFSPDDLPRVFESFVRGKRGAGSSLGLGLALVRRIAEAHGGQAFAENLSERGARVGFTVRENGDSTDGVRT